jgi:hypothetical protein
MKSIYRFRRAAEVRLFIESQAQRRVARAGRRRRLTRNFRSQRSIVDWVNRIFAHVLPRESDAGRGEAGYRSAYADASTGDDVAPSLDLAPTRSDEADVVVARIREALAAGLGSIAVLVRARSHAQALLPALRAAGIEFSAVELEGLFDRLATRDVLSLARALAQPCDRLAWLAILRAPWCGLPLADLLAVAQRAVDRPIPDALADPDVRTALGDDGRTRIERLWTALAPALAARGHQPFALRVRAAWLALCGPACTASALDRAGADRVFALLADQERGGDLPDYDRVTALAERLFAEASDSPSTKVQLMTLHRAKGLQFDAVILPALDLETGGSGQPVLRWKVREHDGATSLVLAPMRAKVGMQAAHDPVYRWLGTLDAAEEMAELGRLLYVGATRAKRRLHLTAVAEGLPDGSDWKRPARGSPLGDSGPRCFVTARTRAPAVERPGDPRRGRSPAAPPTVWAPASAPPRRLHRSQARRRPCSTGRMRSRKRWAVSHRLLAQIAAEGVDRWDERRCTTSTNASSPSSTGGRSHVRQRAAERCAVIARTRSAIHRAAVVRSGPRRRAQRMGAGRGTTKGSDDVVVDRSLMGGRRYVATSRWINSVAIPRRSSPRNSSAIDRSSPATPASSARSMHDRSGSRCTTRSSTMAGRSSMPTDRPSRHPTG